MNLLKSHYRYRNLGGTYMVTSDRGGHCFLSEHEFTKLANGETDELLNKKLATAGILFDESKINEEIESMREKQAFLFEGTSLHIIVVTLKCNMHCVYCHAGSVSETKKEFDMGKETATKTVDFIFHSPSRNITIEFQGGEPLLNWEVVRHIIGYAMEKNKKANKNLSFSLVSNLSVMDEEKMHYLIENNVGVCASLDGPRELHDSNRKSVSGSNHKQVVKWLKKFKEEYEKKKIKHKINALTTLTRKSLAYPREIVDEYVSLGMDSIHLRFLNKLGVAKSEWGSINYSADEYMDFWSKAMMHITKLRGEGKEIEERIVKIMVDKITNKFDPNYLDLRSPCGAVIGQLAYNYDGKIYSCDEGRMLGSSIFLVGDVLTDEYSSVVTSDKSCAIINTSINDQYSCDDCVYKPYCGVCPVCNYAERGSPIPNLTQADRCKIYKQQFDWVVRERFLNKEKNNSPID